jgi:hypothetical protein
MYCLPQIGKQANLHFVKLLEPYGIISRTLHLADVLLTLFIEDFGTCYTCKANIEHIILIFELAYKCSVDWTGGHYIGLTVAWSYDTT